MQQNIFLFSTNTSCIQYKIKLNSARIEERICKMRTFFIIILLVFSSCSSETAIDSWMQETGKPKVLATTAMIDDIVSKIGGNYIDHLTLIFGELDPHSYELIKGDDEKLKRADLIFFNGLGLEHGASLRHALQSHPHAVSLGASIDPDLLLYVGDHIDPHIWMDISLWAQVIDPIIKALSTCDPVHAEEFKLNGEALKKQMTEAHAEIYQLLQAIPPSKRFLVTSHDAFHYFTRGYLKDPQETEWKHRCAAPEGLSPEGTLGISHIQNIIHYLSLHSITVLFPESNVNQDALKKIISASMHKGLHIQLATSPLYGDALGGLTYLEMMKHNALTIHSYWHEGSKQ